MKRPTDPMEAIIFDALVETGTDFKTERECDHELDFELTESGIVIEVKRFHSPRIAAQMARVPNVIVAQGKPAVEMLAKLIRGGI